MTPLLTTRKRDGRHGHREPAHRRAAAQRPQLPQPDRAQPERERRVRRRRPGRRSTGRLARQPAEFDFRPAARVQLLHARRRGQHRRQLQHLHLSAVGGRAGRIQGADGHLLGGIRPRRRSGERRHEVGLERLSTARCSSSTATTSSTPAPTPSRRRRPPRPSRISAGISSATRPAARWPRTGCSSCRTGKATRTTRRSWPPSRCPRRRCGRAISRRYATPLLDPATCTVAGDVRTCQPFAGNRIPSNRIAPTSQKLLEFYPEPNAAGTENNYIARRTASSTASSTPSAWTSSRARSRSGWAATAGATTTR